MVYQTSCDGQFYFASYYYLLVNIDTVLCFVFDHNIPTPLKRKQYLITDFLSFGFLVKLLLPYLMRLYGVRNIG